MSRVVIREVEFQYTEVRIALPDEYYIQGIGGLDLETEVPREMKRSISSSNLDLVGRLKKSIEADKKESPSPNATPYFDVFSAFSFILPLSTLEREKPAVREEILEGVIDKHLQNRLEVEEELINWNRSCIHLSAVRTKGDGNCLMHAASLAMWGLHDRSLILRLAVHEALSNVRNKNLFDRWQGDRRLELQQMNASMEVHQWQAEYQQLVDMVDPHSRSGRMESLTDFHIFVLCNVLRRPVIVYGTVRISSLSTGASFAPNNIPGVYLPLLWNTESISKDPIMLSHAGGHYSALVPSDQQPGGQPPAVPLCNSRGEPLAVKFMLPSEVHDKDTFLRDYMLVSHLRGSSKPIPIAQLNVKDQPTVISRLWMTHVKECKKPQDSPVPTPRRGTTNLHHAPSSDTAEGSSKCLQCNSPGATTVTSYLCRDCFQAQLQVMGGGGGRGGDSGGGGGQHNTALPHDNPRHHQQPPPLGAAMDSLPSPMTMQFQQEQPPYQQGSQHKDPYPGTSNADLTGNRQEKCKTTSCMLYGSYEKQGYCSQCYKDRAQRHDSRQHHQQQPVPCIQCRVEEGVEMFGNVCRTCHGKNMHFQPRVQSTQGSAVLQHTQREDPIGHKEEPAGRTGGGGGGGVGGKLKKCTYGDCGCSADPASNGHLCSEHFFQALDRVLPGFDVSRLAQERGENDGREAPGQGGSRNRGYNDHRGGHGGGGGSRQQYEHDLPAPERSQRPNPSSSPQKYSDRSDDRRGQTVDRLDISGRMVDVSTQKCFVCMNNDPLDNPYGVFVCSKHAKEMRRTLVLQRGSDVGGRHPDSNHQQHLHRAGDHKPSSRSDLHAVQSYADRYDDLPDPQGPGPFQNSGGNPYGGGEGGGVGGRGGNPYGGGGGGGQQSVFPPTHPHSGHDHRGGGGGGGSSPGRSASSQDKLCATPGCSNLHQGKGKGIIYCEDCEHSHLANRGGVPVPHSEQCKEATCSRRKAPNRMNYCERCYEERYLAPDNSY